MDGSPQKNQATERLDVSVAFFVSYPVHKFSVAIVASAEL